MAEAKMHGKTAAEWEAWLRPFVSRYPARFHDDLMQEARLGLLKAETRFDAGQGYAFKTFAFHCVKGNLRHYMRDRVYTIRTPAHAQANGVRVPCSSFSDLASYCAETGKEEDAMDTIERFVATERRALENDTVSFLQIKDALMRLPEKQRYVVLRHDVDGISLTDIGRELGFSQNYMSHLRTKAHERLRRLLSAEGIRTRQ